MESLQLKFNKEDRPEFFKMLNLRVSQYFQQNNITKYANGKMILKTSIMVALYFVPAVFIISGLYNSLLMMFGLWILMGIGMGGIGFSVMHDANHGSYSRSKWVNNALGFLINFIGGFHINWKIQHNVLHHTFTNVHEADEDIQGKGLLRLSPDQDLKPMNKYQKYYAPVIYSIMTLFWITVKDFAQLTRYKNRNLLGGNMPTYASALAQVILLKIGYWVLFLVLPLIFSPFSWLPVVSGFVIMHLICGLLLGLVFQPAHVIEETHFYKADEDASLENSWAIHQLMTTSNFGRENRLLSWYVGGLNFQIEHHLFPHICHIHYRDISPIVKQTAEEYGIPYFEHSSFRNAVASHFRLLDQLGNQV